MPSLDSSRSTLDSSRILLAQGVQPDACQFQIDAPLGGIELSAGSSIQTPFLSIASEHVLWIGVGEASGTGLIRIFCQYERSGDRIDLVTLDLRHATNNEIRLSLDPTEERQSYLISHFGNDGESCYITNLRICHILQAGRINALANYQTRLANEMGCFSSSSYLHPIYGNDESVAGNGNLQTHFRRLSQYDSDREKLLQSLARKRLCLIDPLPGEVAFNYAMRSLSSLLPHTPPDFFSRVKGRSNNGAIRILSILAGAARIEAQLLSHCSGAVELVLLDASTELIQRAADTLSILRDGITVTCLVGDINEGLPLDRQFDIIICVSALHHVARLELVLSQINECLADDGEFWSIGEQIGRNGNQLWPDACQMADIAFSGLPEKYRRNAYSGLIDEQLSKQDYSIGCFEGIRSEELESLLEAYLLPVHLYKRNAFLWRLVDATYSDNYDLCREEDMHYLRGLVAAEAAHWTCGGRSTELHGIYRKKMLNI